MRNPRPAVWFVLSAIWLLPALPSHAAPAPIAKGERVWYVTQPPYPDKARAAREQGRGTVRVTTDSQGKVVKAVMETSTGSARLDANTIKCALGWHGPPAGTRDVPVSYALVSHSLKQLSAAEMQGWFISMPPYPEEARMGSYQGSCVVRVRTDATGNILKAALVQSTHVRMLDNHTLGYVSEHWHGPPNATILVPVTYRLARTR